MNRIGLPLSPNIEPVPTVSVLLPNLNYRRFLEERLNSILVQTLTDWELIIVDGYSDDGAWQLIQKYAGQDERIKASQAPRDGIYAALNHLIRAARGKYVYIATSDDTMMPDCLEKMVNALDKHPECDICHVCLKLIDESGRKASYSWRDFLAGQFYGELLEKPHIRLAPYDGILHCALYTVYTSLTQLLLRRSAFDKVGLFHSDWGSEGDFEWGMRATLVCNTFHIPEELATWRVHPKRASIQFTSQAARRARCCEMVEAALPTLFSHSPDWHEKVHLSRLLLPYRWEQLILGLQESQGQFRKLRYLLHFLFISPTSVGKFLIERAFGKKVQQDNITWIRKEIERLRLQDHLQVCVEKF